VCWKINKLDQWYQEEILYFIVVTSWVEGSSLQHTLFNLFYEKKKKTDRSYSFISHVYYQRSFCTIKWKRTVISEVTWGHSDRKYRTRLVSYRRSLPHFPEHFLLSSFVRFVLLGCVNTLAALGPSHPQLSVLSVYAIFSHGFYILHPPLCGHFFHPPNSKVNKGTRPDMM
jgi:hypothetical protein